MILQLQNYSQGSETPTTFSVVIQFIEHDYTWSEEDKKHTRNKLNLIVAPTLEFVPAGSTYTVNTSPSITGYTVKRTAVAGIYSDNEYHQRNTNTSDYTSLQPNNQFTMQSGLIITHYCKKN